MRWDEEGNKPDTLTVETLLYFAYCLQLTDLLSLKTWLLKSLEGEEDERASEWEGEDVKEQSPTGKAPGKFDFIKPNGKEGRSGIRSVHFGAFLTQLDF